MTARWRLQLLAELQVGTAVRQAAVAEESQVRRLGRATRGAG